MRRRRRAAWKGRGRRPRRRRWRGVRGEVEAADPDGGERVVRGREALVVGGQRGAAASYGALEREVLRHGDGARGKWRSGGLEECAAGTEKSGPADFSSQL